MNTQFVITETRKERIQRQQKEKTKAWKTKTAGITLSALVGTAELLTIGADNVHAQNNIYTVSKGDTLSEIAMTYKISIDQLKKENKLHKDTIFMGQRLAIPSASNKKAAIVNPEKTQALSITNKPKKEYVTSGIYNVAAGDTLWEIAQRFGISVESLKRANELDDDFVVIGQRLKIETSLIKTQARIMGAEDNFTIEVMINKQVMPLHVAYGTAEEFVKDAGKNVSIIYKEGEIHTLLSYKVVQ